MIIVTHPLFSAYAEKLADIHRNSDGLISQIVTPQQIYNEFSGGIPDIAAIRNFLRMKYLKQKGSSHPLKYLLLFGDGSYENKTPPPNNPNFIPTYQSQNSNVVVSSFTSDDFYGLLDDGEGEAEGTILGAITVNFTLSSISVISTAVAIFRPCPNLSTTPALTVVTFHVSIERGYWLMQRDSHHFLKTVFRLTMLIKYILMLSNRLQRLTGSLILKSIKLLTIVSTQAA